MRLAIYTRADPGFSLCRDIRTQIFVDEYNMPVSCERDNQDYRATHYLVRDRHNTPIGVARSVVEGDFCKIQRFALLAPYRDAKKIARAFSLVLNDSIQRYPHMSYSVYAEKDQEELYQSFGFVTEGETFLYAGIVLRNMVLSYEQAKNHHESGRENHMIPRNIMAYTD